MKNHYYVDMHCHSAFKPYSWQRLNGKGPYKCRNVKSSIWYNDPPKRWDRALNRALSLTRFTQSDFRTLTKGDVKIISANLSPVEKGLFKPRWPFRILGFLLIKTILEFRFNYIRLIRRKNRNYFTELEDEYEYYRDEEKEQQNRTYPTEFKLIRHYNEIEQDMEEADKDIIYVFFSIEGCHVFNNGGLKNSITDENSDKEKEGVLKKVQKVKDWPHRPLFISLAHHWNNDLCGHAKSLPSFFSWVVKQKIGMGGDISELGREVLHKLLEEPTRIYIDIKHMSALARRQYYDILKDDYRGQKIPVLVSHGAVNGFESIDSSDKGAIIDPSFYDEDVRTFKQDDINFFDDEIITIAKTRGFFGIQLDERRLCSKKHKKKNRKIKERGKLLYFQAGLIWKQIKHIAVVLDNKEKMDAWDTAALGSDYDGLVDPPNGFWTSDDFGILEENLIHHAVNYFIDEVFRNQLNEEKNKPKETSDPAKQKQYVQEYAQKVIDKFMRGNAQRFLEEFLCGDRGIPEDENKEPDSEENLKKELIKTTLAAKQIGVNDIKINT